MRQVLRTLLQRSHHGASEGEFLLEPRVEKSRLGSAECAVWVSAKLSLASTETASLRIFSSSMVSGGDALTCARTSAATYLEGRTPRASARRLRAIRSPGRSRIVIRSVEGD